MKQFQIWHWASIIKDLENGLYPHKSRRNHDTFWDCVKELHDLGFYVMIPPNEEVLFVDTRTFSQR